MPEPDGPADSVPGRGAAPADDAACPGLTAAPLCWSRGRPALVANAALSLLVQLLRVLSVWTLALAVGAPGDLIDYAVVAPLMFFIMVLPIPAASIGIEQGVFVVMLGLIGVPGEMAFTMAVLNRLLTILSVLPGVVCILFGLGLGPRKDVRLAVGSK